MTKKQTKNAKIENQSSTRSRIFKDAPLSLDQSLHEVQSTDIEKTSF